MKNSQKGFINIFFLVLAVVIVIIGVAGYFVFNQKNTPPQKETNNASTTTSEDKKSDFSVYKNEKYRFEISYPASFTFRDSESVPDRWAISTWNGEVKPIGCGGFPSGPDNLVVSWGVSDRQNGEIAGVNLFEIAEKRYNSPELKTVLIGDKTLREQKSGPGMCGESDELLWMDPSGRYIVGFNIWPSNTNLTEEYKTIIESFRFF